jgi:phosphoglucomutase
MGFPPSDVLYFELAGGAWLCARPSGTEPKIKLYSGISHPESEGKAQEALRSLQDAAAALLK